MEVLTLGRRELTTRINTAAQMLDNAIITIQPGISLQIRNKMGIAIFMFPCRRHQNDTFEIKRSLIPPRNIFHQTIGRTRRRILRQSICRTQSFLVLEILHIGSSRLNYNEINSRANLISFGITNIACRIRAYISFQFRIHPNLRYTT